MRLRNKTNRSTSATTRRLVALLVAGFVMMAASSAFALDNYADRTGLFVGIGIGGGVGAVDMDAEEISAGFGDSRQLGLGLHGVIGGGLNKNIVLGLGINSWIRTVDKESQEFSHQHWNFLAQGDFFLIKGLYVEGGAGLAYAMFDAQQGANDSTEYAEMGLALRGGAGYEFFINGTHALGINVGYTRHFYSNASFDTFGAGIGIRWY
jgi:hypothetical protein